MGGLRLDGCCLVRETEEQFVCRLSDVEHLDCGCSNVSQVITLLSTCFSAGNTTPHHFQDKKEKKVKDDRLLSVSPVNVNISTSDKDNTGGYTELHSNPVTKADATASFTNRSEQAL